MWCLLSFPYCELSCTEFSTFPRPGGSEALKVAQPTEGLPQGIPLSAKKHPPDRPSFPAVTAQDKCRDGYVTTGQMSWQLCHSWEFRWQKSWWRWSVCWVVSSKTPSLGISNTGELPVSLSLFIICKYSEIYKLKKNRYWLLNEDISSKSIFFFCKVEPVSLCKKKSLSCFSVVSWFVILINKIYSLTTWIFFR